MEQFGVAIGDSERDEDIPAASAEERNAIRFNLGKIRDRAEALLRKHFKP